MAGYKVPQDVEADDKLLGPFSFRQFIYLIIAVMGIAIGWGLAQLFIPLAIIPLPIVLLFGALALPLRKDQPMEVYLAAVVSFFLKPRKRLWQPDGVQSLVEIVAPKVVEVQRAKDLSQAEAEQRLSYLADIVDTQGWSVRGVASPDAASPMRGDAYYEAQQTPDILDTSGGVARSFDTMISQADSRRRQDAINRMHQPPTPAAQPAPAQPAIPDPYTALDPSSEKPLRYNPYPAMRQSVIDPNGDRAHAMPPTTQPPAPAAVSEVPANPQAIPSPNNVSPTPPVNITTSETAVSPDIMNLANNSDLSIETIAHEAHRIQEKQEKADDEVVISLH